jgi:hypothetical protein
MIFVNNLNFDKSNINITVKEKFTFFFQIK